MQNFECCSNKVRQVSSFYYFWSSRTPRTNKKRDRQTVKQSPELCSTHHISVGNISFMVAEDLFWVCGQKMTLISDAEEQLRLTLIFLQ